MTDPVKSSSSPCVAVCRLDSRDVCTGCYRTLDEIRRWRDMDDSERKQVLGLVGSRAAGVGN